jgi:hypothetical protein
MITGFEIRNAMYRSYGIRNDPDLDVFDPGGFRKALEALRRLAGAMGL